MATAQKTQCPISRSEFLATAKPIQVVINGVPMQAEVKEFSTGSIGWYVNGQTMLPVGDTNVKVQVGLNLSIANSKQLPK